MYLDYLACLLFGIGFYLILDHLLDVKEKKCCGGSSSSCCCHKDSLKMNNMGTIAEDDCEEKLK